jgi:hypothetical protein
MFIVQNTKFVPSIGLTSAYFPWDSAGNIRHPKILENGSIRGSKEEVYEAREVVCLGRAKERPPGCHVRFGEPALSFVRMHCIFDSCKASG